VIKVLYQHNYVISFAVRVHRQLISMFAYGVDKSKDHHHTIGDASHDDNSIQSSNHHDSTSPRPSPSPCPSPSHFPMRSTTI